MSLAKIKGLLNGSLFCSSGNFLFTLKSFVNDFKNNEIINSPNIEVKKEINASVIRIDGPIGFDVDDFDKDYLGFVDVNDIRKSLNDSENDESVTHHVLYINSPGGTVTGIKELYRYIKSLKKPVFGYAGGEMASGALWIGSACDYLSCAPSAMVGSVGCYICFTDNSKQMENNGIELIVIQAGTEKLTGLPGHTTEQAIQELQDYANNVHSEFKSSILENRQVDEKYMEGMLYQGAKALSIGFVDANHDSFDDFIKEVLKND